MPSNKHGATLHLAAERVQLLYGLAPDDGTPLHTAVRDLRVILNPLVRPEVCPKCGSANRDFIGIDCFGIEWGDTEMHKWHAQDKP